MSQLSFSRVALAACAFLAVLLSASVAASAAPAQSPPQRELRSLSAAIEEVRRGPFHGPARGDSGGGTWIADRRESSAHPPRGPARLFGAERETPRVDSVPGLSWGKVFLGTVATSISAYPVALAFLLEGAYWRGGKSTGALVMLGGAIIGVVGPAIGAQLAGGRFLPGVLGSVFGIGLGGFTAGVVGDDRGVHESVLFSIFSLVHVGTTTLFVVKAEQYAAAGR